MFVLYRLEEDESRNQFNHLIEAINDIGTINPWDREEGAYEALNQLIQQEVSEKPILAHVMSSKGESLLSAACANLNLTSSHHVIKCLIQTNPSALFGPPRTTNTNNQHNHVPIFRIAGHPQHCVLMPWIASNHTWVLDHELCLKYPPVFDLLRTLRQRSSSCTSTIIKDFFEAYPRAFEQEHPIFDSILIMNPYVSECEVDVFKWLAERCPNSTFLKTNSNGHTPLHLACMSLCKHLGRNSLEICKYLIRKCPAAVHTPDDDDMLPIHYLKQGKCGYRMVREVFVCLLRAYPESIDMRPPSGHPPGRLQTISFISWLRLPSSSRQQLRFKRFIQSIKPYLDEEKELKETIASFEESKSSFNAAVSCTNDKLTRAVSTVFHSWGNSFIDQFEKERLDSISEKLSYKIYVTRA